MKKNGIWIHSLLFLLFFVCINYPANAQSPLKFPAKIKYKVFQNERPIGKAALFYTEKTGIKRFGKELSSVRLTIFYESELDFQYMYEAFVFSNNYSLYRDAVINNRELVSQVKIERMSKTSAVTKRSFSFEGKKYPRYIKREIQNSNRDITFVSALPATAGKVAAGTYMQAESFNFLSNELFGEADLVYEGQAHKSLDNKDITAQILALKTGNYGELHRFEIYRNQEGCCFPVKIIMNSCSDNPLEFRIETLPEPSASRNLKSVQALYLDFVDARTRSAAGDTPLGKLVQTIVTDEIKKELQKISARRNQVLIFDKKYRSIFNKNRNTDKLIDITFDMDTPSDKRIGKIFNELKIPEHIDVVVTGQYIDEPKNPMLDIRPIVIFKSRQNIMTENIMFRRDALLCRDEGTGMEKPCPGVQDYISGKIGKFLFYTTSENIGEGGQTIEDIYRMILKYNFFCHPLNYGYQFEVLEKLRAAGRIRKRAFKGTRETSQSVAAGKEFIIKTDSINRRNYTDIITLYWAPLKGKIKTYEEARKLIEDLNTAGYQGYSDWRIPTVDEFLSISGHDIRSNRFFPFTLQKNSGKLWTATLLAESEKKRLTFCNDNVYFIIKRIHEDNFHQLQFDILDESQKAYILPVRSTSGPGKRYVKSEKKILTIANLCFMETRGRSPITTGKLGESLNRAVSRGMNMAGAANKLLSVKKEQPKQATAVEHSNKLTNIFFAPNLTKTGKINRIIAEIMNPQKVDLMVTGIFFEDEKKDMVTIRPVVICKYGQKILVENLQFEKSELGNRERNNRDIVIGQRAAAAITRAVKELLGQT